MTLLKKVEEELNCSICLDTYTDPKLLQCFHVYCLVRLVFRDQQGQLILTCRQVTPVPANGVAGLQPAFHINDMMKTHKKKLASEKSTDSGSTSLPPQEKVSGFCSGHVKEELKLYCERCGELACFHCTLKTGEHHGHDCELVEEAFEKVKVAIGKEIGPSLGRYVGAYSSHKHSTWHQDDT